LSRGQAEALITEKIAFVQEEILYDRRLKRKEMSGKVWALKHNGTSHFTLPSSHE
jgi:hypothetical protein